MNPRCTNTFPFSTTSLVELHPGTGTLNTNIRLYRLTRYRSRETNTHQQQRICAICVAVACASPAKQQLAVRLNADCRLFPPHYSDTWNRASAVAYMRRDMLKLQRTCHETLNRIRCERHTSRSRAFFSFSHAVFQFRHSVNCDKHFNSFNRVQFNSLA